MATELTLATVRDFIQNNGGKVKNKDLVTHFKSLLNDSQDKAEQRQNFKSYINELASVKTEDGEKVIILKTKKKKKHQISGDLPPPPPSPPRERAADEGPSSGSNSAASSHAESVEFLDPKHQESESGRIPLSESRESSIPLSDSKESDIPNSSSRESSVSETRERESSVGPDDEGSTSRVKDFAKKLEKMETDSVENLSVAMRKKKFEDKTENEENIPLEPLNHEFMMAAAKADYHPMAKMLQLNPRLASQKDLTSGYTPLHWACKHGQMDVVKMLAGTYKAQVNIKSHGGYTPLHLAAMGSHEGIIDILAGAYKADVNIRDYSGKKPKQYLSNSASARTIQILGKEVDKKDVKDCTDVQADVKNMSSMLGTKSNIRASFRAYKKQIIADISPSPSPKYGRKGKESNSMGPPESVKKRKDSKKGKEIGFQVPRVKSDSEMNKRSFFI